MNVLVAGGAGYIGSVTVAKLREAGHRVTVLDNLERGHRSALPEDTDLVVGDIGDREIVAETLSSRRIEGVIHLAAYIESGESMKKPLDFFDNNVAKGVQFLRHVAESDVKGLVFSSTAGVYGDAAELPLTESSPINPTSYYSWTKYMFEEILKSCEVYGLNSIILRYFNAAGALPDGSAGEDHSPETHLIPIVFQTLVGERDEFVIYGDDYPTEDGTCVRDYIHVLDLARAHILALEALSQDGSATRTYNVGTGRGHSVKEVVETVERVTGRTVPGRIGARRPGDWPAAYADASKIRDELGWEAEYDLEAIIETAWMWYQKHPDGFA